MKVSVTQEKIARALNLVKDIAASRNELAILNNILLRTDGGRLLVAATNLEIASMQYIGAKIETPGSITIPARLVSEFISNLLKSLNAQVHRFRFKMFYQVVFVEQKVFLVEGLVFAELRDRKSVV